MINVTKYDQITAKSSHCFSLGPGSMVQLYPKCPFNLCDGEGTILYVAESGIPIIYNRRHFSSFYIQVTDPELKIFEREVLRAWFIIPQIYRIESDGHERSDFCRLLKVLLKYNLNLRIFFSSSSNASSESSKHNLCLRVLTVRHKR